MLILKKSKKALMPLMLILVVGTIILVIYGLLYLPFFKLQKEVVNYIITLVLWILIQVSIIYAFVKLGILGTKYFMKFKNNLNKWALNIKKFMITHY